ncbi:hypothetical protein IR083_09945 [Dysgonomonas sp. GY75]|uniref:hypothetical protein n=1 Tax=Dysgonomonas sp. GY75 TaxID=2780419 RepID=UPI0018835B73|nr:hypothetical protein [Dysgonomonas sp. GY75]MBF0649141.1 hypothetical protein [Dysgonomonas sp. GY75]
MITKIITPQICEVKNEQNMALRETQKKRGTAIRSLQKELWKIRRKETKVPRKLKKKLKRIYGQNDYLRMKRLGCFCKPYIQYNGYRIHPLLHFGGGRRNYLCDLLQNSNAVLVPEGGQWEVKPIKHTPEKWDFKEFPDKFKKYFESTMKLDPGLEKNYLKYIYDTGMPTKNPNWLHHLWIENNTIRERIRQNPESPSIRENWQTVDEKDKNDLFVELICPKCSYKNEFLKKDVQYITRLYCDNCNLILNN